MTRVLLALWLLAPAAAGQGFARWAERIERVTLRAGERSAFEQADDELVRRALEAARGRGVRLAEGTEASWRRIVARSRREGLEAVTLSCLYVSYDYDRGRTGYDRIVLRGEGAAVTILPAGAPQGLVDHEAGHARMLEGTLRLGALLSAVAFRRHDGREAPIEAEADLRARAEAVIRALVETLNALDEAYDRTTRHREPGEVPGRLLAGLEREMRSGAAATDDARAIAARGTSGLAALRSAGDVEAWARGR